MQAVPGQQVLTASTHDGKVLIVEIDWQISFEGQRRVVSPRISDPIEIPLEPGGRAIEAFSARVEEGGDATGKQED